MGRSHYCSRRRFLKKSSAFGFTTPVLSTLLNLELARHASAAETEGNSDRKTLVVINLSGGFDGYQLLVRNDAEYDTYRASRGNLATAQEDLIPLNLSDGGGFEEFGLHPAAPGLASLFNGTGNFAGEPCLSFAANIGTLIRPLTQDEFFNGVVGTDVPRGIASHNTQTEQWQTTLPQGTINLRGWLGRSADVIAESLNAPGSSMGLALSGNNTIQVGEESAPLVVNTSSPLGLTGTTFTNPAHPLTVKNLMHRRLLERDGVSSKNLLDRAFAETSLDGLEKQERIKEIFTEFSEDDITYEFPDTTIGRQLKEAFILINTRETQGLTRQTIFIESDQWDHHRGILELYPSSLEELSTAIAIFQRNLNEKNLQNSVLSFTTSEFARTLRSNGNGTDHAWGGPQFIFGGAVSGGRVVGRFPELALRGSPDLAGRGGIILPENSCDEYFAPALRWFGVPENQLSTVLPNWANFESRAPLDYLA